MSVIADTFNIDQVSFGYIRGVEFNLGISRPVGPDIGIPIECRAIIRMGILALVRIWILRRMEFYGAL